MLNSAPFCLNGPQSEPKAMGIFPWRRGLSTFDLAVSCSAPLVKVKRQVRLRWDALATFCRVPLRVSPKKDPVETLFRCLAATRGQGRTDPRVCVLSSQISSLPDNKRGCGSSVTPQFGGLCGW